MTEVEIAAQKEVQQLVQELDAIQTRLETIHARLPVAADEAAMLEGEKEPDFSTEMRSVIECVLTDYLRPAIRDLATAAAYRPKENKE
ncbi:MAG TPA: hypothetical protein VGX68_12675 [Thermoanaerobaculia bacterium]|jgi:hypothetical protein|nr:hypothetical protein [Thermoanaerobaculia bacterium]